MRARGSTKERSILGTMQNRKRGRLHEMEMEREEGEGKGGMDDS